MSEWVGGGVGVYAVCVCMGEWIGGWVSGWVGGGVCSNMRGCVCMGVWVWVCAGGGGVHVHAVWI